MPNVQQRRCWLPSEGRWIRLQLSTKTMKTIDKRGIDPWLPKYEPEENASDAPQRPPAGGQTAPTAGTGHTCVTRKKPPERPDRLRLRKYDPVVHKHVEYQEER